MRLTKMLGVAVLALYCSMLLSSTAHAAPNIIVLLADDLGLDDVGFFGNADVETPNLDALAQESVRFNDFYVHPVCAPTRASLLTGRHFLRTGVWGVHSGRDFMNLDEETFADALRRAGYKTGMFGKWHSGKTDGYLPWDRGFDRACMTQLYHYVDNIATCNQQKQTAPRWIQDHIVNWSLDFMDKNSDGPFLLYVPFMAPHIGKIDQNGGKEDWVAPEELVSKYTAKGLPDDLSRLYGMVEMLDTSVGKILSGVSDLGIEENTVVFFMSDNGPLGLFSMHPETWAARNGVSNLVQGQKGFLYEVGIRSHLLVRWTGQYSPGEVNSAPIVIEDIYPTLLELGGAQPGPKPLDGTSITKLLLNPTSPLPKIESRIVFDRVTARWTYAKVKHFVLLPINGTDKSELVLGGNGMWMARQGRYKFMNINQTEVLFDIEEDPTESRPISDEAITGPLRTALNDWWNGIVDDPASFAIPYFIIGRNDVSEILAAAASDKSPAIKVRSHVVDGNVGPASFLLYKVIVEQGGVYTVSWNVWRDHSWSGVATIKLVCGEDVAESRVAVELGGNNVLGRLDVPFTGTQCTMRFRIVKGRGKISIDKFFFMLE